MVESFGVWKFGDGKNDEMGKGSERAAEQKKREGLNEVAIKKNGERKFWARKNRGDDLAIF